MNYHYHAKVNFFKNFKLLPYIRIKLDLQSAGSSPYLIYTDYVMISELGTLLILILILRLDFLLKAFLS